VRKLLTGIGFSRQVNRKSDEGSGHPDRNAQFEYIRRGPCGSGGPTARQFPWRKELVGNYRNAGSDPAAEGNPERVKVHDFADKALGKVAPYGVYETLPPTRAGSATASPATPPSSSSPPFALGSRGSAGRAIRRQTS
jgi:hypothetical protein